MNALVNSQLEELDKFLSHYGDNKPVTYGRYTGQETQEDRWKLFDAVTWKVLDAD